MNDVKMKAVKFLLLISMFSFHFVYAQKIALTESNLVANKVAMSIEKFQGKQVVKVAKDPAVKEVDEPTFVRIKNVDFTNGDIEVSVLSRLLPTAAPSDRGFIGVAFRINDSNTAFECIYIRPTNGRAEDQVRRNHSIQYFSYPEYKFSRLRKENPEMYESYADMGLNEWIKMKIVVQDNRAKLFLNNQQHPSLIVNDLKHGAGVSGAIGLFVDVGTEGYFKDLRVNIRK